MATKEQVERMIDQWEKAFPIDFCRRVNETQAGIRAVMLLLYESDGTVTAGNISTQLNISTARVAVLLKKMVAKGLITKKQGITDGRVTVVKLTALGEQTISEMQADRYAQVSNIIDAVGEERLQIFIKIANEIRVATKEPRFHF